MEKPKLNLHLKVDKEAEAERLKALLKDDFVDDLSSGPLVPVQLPMVDTGTLFKKEKEEEEELSEEVKQTKKKNPNRLVIIVSGFWASKGLSFLPIPRGILATSLRVFFRNPYSLVSKESNVTLVPLIRPNTLTKCSLFTHDSC